MANRTCIDTGPVHRIRTKAGRGHVRRNTDIYTWAWKITNVHNVIIYVYNYTHTPTIYYNIIYYDAGVQYYLLCAAVS